MKKGRPRKPPPRPPLPRLAGWRMIRAYCRFEYLSPPHASAPVAVSSGFRPQARRPVAPSARLTWGPRLRSATSNPATNDRALPPFQCFSGGNAPSFCSAGRGGLVDGMKGDPALQRIGIVVAGEFWWYCSRPYTYLQGIGISQRFRGGVEGCRPASGAVTIGLIEA